jgi:hypothetical protein
MPVTYVPSLKTKRMQDVIGEIDADAGPGSLEIGTVGMSAVLISFVLQKPSFTESGGVITLAGAPLTADGLANGNAAEARIRRGNGNMVVTGLSVGLTGSDIIINSVVVNSGQEMTIESGAITHS